MISPVKTIKTDAGIDIPVFDGEIFNRSNGDFPDLCILHIKYMHSTSSTHIKFEDRAGYSNLLPIKMFLNFSVSLDPGNCYWIRRLKVIENLKIYYNYYVIKCTSKS